MRVLLFFFFLLTGLPLIAQDTLSVKGNRVKVVKDSVLVSTGSLKGGKPHGKWLYYDLNGRKTHQINYRNGKQHHAHYFNPDGTIHHSVNRRGRVFTRKTCNC